MDIAEKIFFTIAIICIVIRLWMLCEKDESPYESEGEKHDRKISELAVFLAIGSIAFFLLMTMWK